MDERKKWNQNYYLESKKWSQNYLESIIKECTSFLCEDITTLLIPLFLICGECKFVIFEDDIHLCGDCGWLKCRRCLTEHWDQFPNYLTMEEANNDPQLPKCRYGHNPCSPYELDDLISENRQRQQKKKRKRS